MIHVGAFWSQSRQTWKAWTAIGIFVIGAAAVFIGLVLQPDPVTGRVSGKAIGLQAAGSFMLLMSLAWAANAIRCPKCGGRFVWQILKTETRCHG
jgi:hypothetical protein